MLHHNEPVLRDGAVVGFVTSGVFSAAQGCAVGLCLIEQPTGTFGGEALEKGDYCVLVEGRIIPAILQRKAFARYFAAAAKHGGMILSIHRELL